MVGIAIPERFINQQYFIICFFSMIAVSWFIFFWMDSQVIKNIIFIGDNYVQIKRKHYAIDEFEEIEIQLNKNINSKKDVNSNNRIKFKFYNKKIIETKFNIEGEFVKNLDSFKNNYRKIKIIWC